MFGKKRIAELEAQLKTLQAACAETQRHAFLIAIERKDRLNRFTFMRGQDIYVVETMGLISDNISEWKERLL